LGRLDQGDDGTPFYTEWEETYESFDQMNLHENLLRGIYAYGELFVGINQL
jgi:translation initiation factor 4A